MFISDGEGVGDGMQNGLHNTFQYIRLTEKGLPVKNVNEKHEGLPYFRLVACFPLESPKPSVNIVT